MGKTNIAWANEVWNPVVGCTRLSEGCDKCYAFALHDRRHVAWKRGRWPAAPEQYHLPFSHVTLHPERLDEPLHWRKPRRVFVNSVSDTFHDQVPDVFIDRIFATMARSPQHTYQLLSKRPERMLTYLSAPERMSAVLRAMDEPEDDANPEAWMPVADYEGFYEVSSFGRVRRSGGILRGRRNIEGLLVPRPTRGGYLAVCLSRDGVVHQVKVHRLVLKAFSGPPPDAASETRHRNGNRTDNRAINLLWGSKQENMADAARHGMAGVWAKSQVTRTPAEVGAIRAARAAGSKLADLATIYGSTKQQVSAICLGRIYKPAAIPWPLPNCWLGVSIENDLWVGRADILRQTPAAVRFISAEPLLGPLVHRCGNCADACVRDGQPCTCRVCHGTGWTGIDLTGIDWLIIGAESGPHARPMDPQWALDLIDRAHAAGVAVFVKQGSGPRPGMQGNLPDWAFALREYPRLLAYGGEV